MRLFPMPPHRRFGFCMHDDIAFMSGSYVHPFAHYMMFRWDFVGADPRDVMHKEYLISYS